MFSPPHLFPPTHTSCLKSAGLQQAGAMKNSTEWALPKLSELYIHFIYSMWGHKVGVHLFDTSKKERGHGQRQSVYFKYAENYFMYTV